MKRIVVLGSTGSIGVNALKVAEDHQDQFHVVGLAAGTRVEELAAQARQFNCEVVAIQDASKAAALEEALAGTGTKVLAGEAGVCELAAWQNVDTVIVAITGAAALKPTLEAIRAGRTIGLANKENLVMAGELVMQAAREAQVQIVPIDSEHSAIFQCLQAHPGWTQHNSDAEIQRILLTSSGGPLKDIPKETFGQLSKDQVMNHPRWKMGPKITVDSATMMNKALEVIEARWLFDVPVDKIEILVHPEAIVHSMVEFIDGSVLAQLGITDMRGPIQYALTFPDRATASWPALDLVEWGQLNFEAPQRDKFPCLDLGAEAAKAGGTLPAVFNAANEACVYAFLEDALPFTQIPILIEKVMRDHTQLDQPSLEQICEADAWAREQVAAQLPGASVSTQGAAS